LELHPKFVREVFEDRFSDVSELNEQFKERSAVAPKTFKLES